MFDRFLKAFISDAKTGQASEQVKVPLVDEAMSELISRFAGQSFNGGLYRILRLGDMQSWDATIGSAFPPFKDGIACFAVDWLGRVFALDSRRHINGRPGVTIFEPGTGQALIVPCDIERFHEEELIDYRDAALAENFFNQWIEIGRSPAYPQCVGYKRPLFLGGTDTVENLELIDLDVYWTISAQLISKLKNVPNDTRVKINGG